MMNVIYRFMNGIKRYIGQLNWVDLGLLKICLCAIGVLIGLALPRQVRKTAIFAAILAVVCTYVPLMEKFFHVTLNSPVEE